MDILKEISTEELRRIRKELYSSDKKQILDAAHRIETYAEASYDLKPLFKEMQNLLFHTDEVVRKCLVRSLSLIVSTTDIHIFIPWLTKSLSDPYEYVRLYSIYTFTNLFRRGYDILDAIPEIIWLLGDSNPDVAYEAANLVTAYQCDIGNFEFVARKLLSNENLHVLKGSLWALRSIRLKEEFIELLFQYMIKILESNEEELIRRVCETLSYYSNRVLLPSELVNRLEDLLQNQEAVSWSVAESLTGHYLLSKETKKLEDFLLKSPHIVRSGTLAYLERIFEKKHILYKELIGILNTCLLDKDYEIRKYASRTLAHYYLNDRDWDSFLKMLEMEPLWVIGKNALLVLLYKVKHQNLDIHPILKSLIKKIEIVDFEQYPLEVIEEYCLKGKRNAEKVETSLRIARPPIGEKTETIRTYCRRAKLNPPYSELEWYRIGDNFRREKRYREAVDSYRNAIYINPKNAGAWNNLGICYTELEEIEKALDAFLTSLKINPEQHQSWANYGNLFKREKKYEEALRAYKKSVELKPTYAQGWANLATGYKAVKDLERAIECSERALSLLSEGKEQDIPSLVQTEYNLACYYCLSGAKENSLRHLQRALSFHPELREKAKEDEDFISIREEEEFKNLVAN